MLYFTYLIIFLNNYCFLMFLNNYNFLISMELFATNNDFVSCTLLGFPFPG